MSGMARSDPRPIEYLLQVKDLQDGEVFEEFNGRYLRVRVTEYEMQDDGKLHPLNPDTGDTEDTDNGRSEAVQE